MQNQLFISILGLFQLHNINPSTVAAPKANLLITQLFELLDINGVSANEDIQFELKTLLAGIGISAEVANDTFSALLELDRRGSFKKHSAKTKDACKAIDAFKSAIFSKNEELQAQADEVKIAEIIKNCPEFAQLLDNKQKLAAVVAEIQYFEENQELEGNEAVFAKLQFKAEQLQKAIDEHQIYSFPNWLHICKMKEYEGIKAAFTVDGEFQKRLYIRVYEKFNDLVYQKSEKFKPTSEAMSKYRLELMKLRDAAEQQEQENNPAFFTKTSNIFAVKSYNTALNNEQNPAIMHQSDNAPFRAKFLYNSKAHDGDGVISIEYYFDTSYDDDGSPIQELVILTAWANIIVDYTQEYHIGGGVLIQVPQQTFEAVSLMKDGIFNPPADWDIPKDISNSQPRTQKHYFEALVRAELIYKHQEEIH